MPIPQTQVVDFAYNVLNIPNWENQGIGWSDLPTAEELNLDMYRFIIASIRDEDRKKGFPLKRFLEGPQAIWETTQRQIFQIQDFWDISIVEDRFLRYVQSIVGWTGNLTRITEVLDFDVLRRLISISVVLWKKRGPEDALVDVISLTTQAQSRIFNWFYYRWLLDVGQMTEDHIGNDIHLIDLPGPPDYNEYRSNLRIFDSKNTLDRILVKNLVKLMRPTGERYTITYLSFMDLFSVEGDAQKWRNIQNGGDIADLIVSNGTGKLINPDMLEEIWAEEGLPTTADGWTKQVAYWKIKINIPNQLAAPGDAGVIWCQSSDSIKGFRISLIPLYNIIHYYETRSGGGGIANEQFVDYSPWGQLYLDQWHSIRVDEQFPDGRKIYVDNNLVLQDTPVYNSTMNGTLAIWHETNATIEIDEVEMFQLPLETEEVGINE